MSKLTIIAINTILLITIDRKNRLISNWYDQLDWYIKRLLILQENKNIIKKYKYKTEKK